MKTTEPTIDDMLNWLDEAEALAERFVLNNEGIAGFTSPSERRRAKAMAAAIRAHLNHEREIYVASEVIH